MAVKGVTFKDGTDGRSISIVKEESRLGVVAHAYNSSILGG